MISTQDMEDFKQEAEILILLGNCEHNDVVGFRKNVVTNLRKVTYNANIRRANILKNYKYYIENLKSFEDEELIFKVCKYVDYLPKGQRATILNFLKYGSIVSTSKKTGESYNTVKANFRHAILKLKDMLEESK